MTGGKRPLSNTGGRGWFGRQVDTVTNSVTNIF
jgi:hypothetical protein